VKFHLVPLSGGLPEEKRPRIPRSDVRKKKIVLSKRQRERAKQNGELLTPLLGERSTLLEREGLKEIPGMRREGKS